MEFIEISGSVLLRLATDEDPIPDGPSADELAKCGVDEDSVIRINRQGDIELRRSEGWDLIGGLLGDFEHRVKRETGLDWA
jgi:hypothetical protein